MTRKFSNFLAFLAVALPLSPQLAHPAFVTPAATYETGGWPSRVVATDFNGDGHQDLAVTNRSSASVSILLGVGDGSFDAKTDFVMGVWPAGVAVGDFNGDGHQDLAVTNGPSASVSILLGVGDGSFDAKTDFVTGVWPAGVAVGDVNGDGYLDLAVTSITSRTVSILLGDGLGAFGPKSDVVIGGAQPERIVLADFNGDGKLDFAVPGGTLFNWIYLRLGNGDGTFQDGVAYAAGNGPTSLSSADLNGDGRLDLVASNHYSDTLSVWLGNGDGTFQTQVAYATGASPVESAITDFDGDGVLDIAVSNKDAPGVSWLRGNGDGTFQAKEDYALAGALGVAVGDFNADGAADLAVAGFIHANAVSVLLGIPAVLDGTCGTANGVATLAAPTTGLCSAGTPSVVTSLNGQHAWSCLGSGGGATVQCGATGLDASPFNGGASGSVALAVTGGGCSVQSASLATPTGLPAGVSLPYGALAFELTGCSGGTATVAISYSGAVTGMTYWKQLGGNWVALPDTVATLSGNTVTLTLVDGGPYDADGQVDGNIRDPGGPGTLADSNGGTLAPIPVLGPLGLMLLSGLLAWLGFAARRR